MATEVPGATLAETVTFIVHAIKQLCWGFERLNSIADDYEDGSPAKAFYLSAIYNYIAVFYLLDKGTNPVGGAFWPALKVHALQNLLNPVGHILNEPMGATNFGEVVRVVRNKLVHPTYRDKDLDRLYAQVDMLNGLNQSRFQDLLVKLEGATRDLAWKLAQSTGLPPEQFGIRDKTGGPA